MDEIGFPDQGSCRQIRTDDEPWRGAIFCDGIELRNGLVEIARVKVSRSDLISSIGTQQDVAGIESCGNCMLFSSAIGKDLVLTGSPLAQIGIRRPNWAVRLSSVFIAF